MESAVSPSRNTDSLLSCSDKCEAKKSRGEDCYPLADPPAATSWTGPSFGASLYRRPPTHWRQSNGGLLRQLRSWSTWHRRSSWWNNTSLEKSKGQLNCTSRLLFAVKSVTCKKELGRGERHGHPAKRQARTVTRCNMENFNWSQGNNPPHWEWWSTGMERAVEQEIFKTWLDKALSNLT